MSAIWASRDLLSYRPQMRGGHASAAFIPLPPPAVEQLNADSNAIAAADASSANQETPVSTAARAAVFVFGGADPFGVSYNDAFVAEEVADNTWSAELVQAHGKGEGPAPRSSHSLTALPLADPEAPYSDFLVFGGMCPIPEPTVYDDIWIAHVHRGIRGVVETESKKKKSKLVQNTVLRWERISSTGGPSPRHSHSAALAGSRQLVVVGGSSGEKPLGDAFLLDVHEHRWTEVRLPTDFIPREMAAAETLNQTTALLSCGRAGETLLGDAWAFIAESDSGVVVRKVSGTVPPRCCHTIQRVGDDDADCRAVLCGGFAEGGFATDSAFRVKVTADDVVLEEVADARRVSTKGGEAMVGLGHSSCQLPSGRRFLVSGIIPNAAAGTVELWEATVTK